jgi:hypothetical protein
MGLLTFNGGSSGFLAPSAGLWRRAADAYWTGWTQYVASMNDGVAIRPQFPLYRGAQRKDYEQAVAQAALTGIGAEVAVLRQQDPAANERLIDRAA